MGHDHGAKVGGGRDDLAEVGGESGGRVVVEGGGELVDEEGGGGTARVDERAREGEPGPLAFGKMGDGCEDDADVGQSAGGEGAERVQERALVAVRQEIEGAEGGGLVGGSAGVDPDGAVADPGRC